MVRQKLITSYLKIPTPLTSSAQIISPFYQAKSLSKLPFSACHSEPPCFLAKARMGAKKPANVAQFANQMLHFVFHRESPGQHDKRQGTIIAIDTKSNPCRSLSVARVTDSSRSGGSEIALRKRLCILMYFLNVLKF